MRLSNTTREGARPLSKLSGVALLVIAAVSAGSCGSSAPERQVGTLTLAISEKTAPALKQGDTTIYQVTIPVALPLRDRPSPLPMKANGYPGDFWFTSTDVELQMDYVITNLEDHDVTVTLMTDAWNDFIRYAPKVVVTEEGPVADPSTENRLIYLPAKSRVRGTVSFDDFERVARVMAAFSNPKPDAAMNPYRFLDSRNDVRQSPLSGYIPTVIAGIRGFDLSLREMSGPDRVLVEANLTIRDHGDHLAPDGAKSTNGPPGRKYSPVAPAPKM